MPDWTGTEELVVGSTYDAQIVGYNASNLEVPFPEGTTYHWTYQPGAIHFPAISAKTSSMSVSAVGVGDGWVKATAYIPDGSEFPPGLQALIQVFVKDQATEPPPPPPPDDENKITSVGVKWIKKG